VLHELINNAVKNKHVYTRVDSFDALKQPTGICEIPITFILVVNISH